MAVSHKATAIIYSVAALGFGVAGVLTPTHDGFSSRYIYLGVAALMAVSAVLFFMKKAPDDGGEK